MKRVAWKVAKNDEFFGRKSKSSKGKALAKSKKQVQKIDRRPTCYTVYYTAFAL
jgi:hypothetical protein